jgi:hypothetical protein
VPFIGIFVADLIASIHDKRMVTKRFSVLIVRRYLKEKLDNEENIIEDKASENIPFPDPAFRNIGKNLLVIIPVIAVRVYLPVYQQCPLFILSDTLLNVGLPLPALSIAIASFCLPERINSAMFSLIVFLELPHLRGIDTHE